MGWNMDFSKYPKHMKVRGIDRTNILTDMDISNIVYTPVKVVNAMLDLLPKEIWSNTDTRFLDPCCKSGVFLERIYWRLEEGLKKQIPTFIDRSDHILTKQLFGLALSDETAKTSRGILYGTHRANHPNAFTMQFKDEEGNIKVIERTVDNNYYGYIDIMKEKTGILFQDTVEEAFGNMKFDVIIGNPPYQENKTTAIYQHFVNKAFEMKAGIVSMVIPTRWFVADNKLNEKVRENVLNPKCTNITYTDNPKEMFKDITLNGGVGYFCVDRSYNGETTLVENGVESTYTFDWSSGDIFIKGKLARSVVTKIGRTTSVGERCILSRDLFGLDTNDYGRKELGDIKIKSSKGNGYLSKGELLKGKEYLDKYKVITGVMVSTCSAVINTPELLGHNEISTRTYTTMESFDDIREAENFITYVKTKLFRFLINCTLNGQSVSRKNYMLIPIQDFSKSWTDAELYDKYNLTKEEIDFIESTIKSME